MKDLLKFDGVGRNILEARIVALVHTFAAIERRLQDRVDNAARTAELHQDWQASHAAAAREKAYLTALADVRDLLADCP